MLILGPKKHLFEVISLLILRLTHSNVEIHILVALMLRGNSCIQNKVAEVEERKKFVDIEKDLLN